MITVRRSDIFIFPNTPYPDKKRRRYTKNDALNLILKSDFDFKQQKNGIFFPSLLFFNVNELFFQALPVTSDFRNSYDAMAPTFSYILRKSLGLDL